MTTINFPAFPASRANANPAKSAAPDEIPIGSPSIAAQRRAVAIASRSDTRITASISARSSTEG